MYLARQYLQPSLAAMITTSFTCTANAIIGPTYPISRCQPAYLCLAIAGNGKKGCGGFFLGVLLFNSAVRGVTSVWC